MFKIHMNFGASNVTFARYNKALCHHRHEKTGAKLTHAKPLLYRDASFAVAAFAAAAAS